MKKSWAIFIIITVLIVACIASIGIGVFFLTRIPPVETQVYEGSTPVHVLLSAPSSLNGWPLNTFIPLQVEAYGGGTISSIELYINGHLYQKVNTPDGWNQPEFTAAWNWQPGTTGSFILLAKSTNTLGGTGISNPIRLEVIDATNTISPYFPKEGETLQSIAGSEQVDITELEKANPSLGDPAQVLPIDIPINLPNPPDPVTNPTIISGFPILWTGVPPQVNPNTLPQPDIEESNPPQGFHIPSVQDLQFWIDKTVPGKTASLPLEPFIKATFSGCDVTLQLTNITYFSDSKDPLVDTSVNESGFFVYQSQDGKPFKRLDTLPAVTNSVTWQYWDGYPLSDQFGMVTYAISAFNTAGETMSAPATLALDQANCQSKERISGSNIQLENGKLILPYSMDLAYLYLSINDTRSIRIPEGDRMFLPSSGVELNLYDYFDTLLSSFSAADFDISMEVWGWVGSELKFVGIYKTTIHRSVLLVCSQEGEGKCSGNGDGEWLTEINFSDQKPIKDQVYEFKWISSQTSKTNEVCYQFAAGPFPDETFWNMNKPISSGCGYILSDNKYIVSNEETFTRSMGSLLYPTSPPEYIGWGAGSEVGDYNSNWFQSNYKQGSAFTIYVRVLPKSEKYDYSRFSNTVILHNSTPPEPSALPPLASPYPSLYEVEILQDTYIPPTFETEENWGCVVIDDDPNNPANNGRTVCPPAIGSEDDCAGIPEALCLLQGLGNAVLFVFDHFVFSFNMIKWEMTEVISSAIPYCHDYGPCRKVVEETVENLVYYGTGLPPHTETTEDLFAGWIGGQFVSSVSPYAQEMGLSEEMLNEKCGPDCKKMIGMKVIEVIRIKKSMESQNACANAYEAYFHNKQAMCLDPSITVHPAAGSGNYPAGITVKVTRKELPAGQLLPPETDKLYRVSIVVLGSNDQTAYGSGYTAQLYSPVVLPVYILSPGESMVLNTSLFPCNSIGSTVCGEDYSWDGMSPVYFNGSTLMEATELCASPGSSWGWVPCADGGYDSWTFDNPTNELVPLP